MNLTVAEDGQQALLCLRHGRFDVVLMDVQMPVMDGIQATQLIRLNPIYADLPIIAMTAHAMVRDQQRCLAAGMNDYITKPFEPSQLFAVLAKWINKQTPQPAAVTTPASAAPMSPARPDAVPQRVEVENCIDFDKGLRRCAKRPELYRKLATRFLSSRRDDASEIRAALEQGNMEAAAMIAHQQISTAGILGADSLSAAARALQLTLMEGPTMDWPHLLEAFDQQLIAVLNALDHHCTNPHEFKTPFLLHHRSGQAPGHLDPDRAALGRQRSTQSLENAGRPPPGRGRRGRVAVHPARQKPARSRE